MSITAVSACSIQILALLGMSPPVACGSGPSGGPGGGGFGKSSSSSLKSPPSSVLKGRFWGAELCDGLSFCGVVVVVVCGGVVSLTASLGDSAGVALADCRIPILCLLVVLLHCSCVMS